MKYRAFSMRKITLLLAVIVAMAFTACDGQSVQVGDKNNDAPGLNNENNLNNIENNNDEEEADKGHGPDDNAETIPPGLLSGTWRVATVEEDTPVAHFDLTHIEGESEITGTYLMGVGISEGFSDHTGDIAEASFEGGAIEIKWNPTNSEDDMFILSDTTRVDDDNFTGAITIQNDPEALFNVTISRQVFED